LMPSIVVVKYSFLTSSSKSALSFTMRNPLNLKFNNYAKFSDNLLISLPMIAFASLESSTIKRLQNQEKNKLKLLQVNIKYTYCFKTPIYVRFTPNTLCGCLRFLWVIRS
jgi:hypothetical protein